MKKNIGYSIAALIILLSAGVDASVIRFAAQEPPASVKAVQVDAAQVDLEFELNELTMTPVQIGAETYVRVQLDEGGRLQEKGEPDLPVITRAVQVPNEGVIRMRWQVLDYEDVPNVLIAPSKGPVSRAIHYADVPYEFAATYAGSAGWPEQAVTMSEPYIIRDCRGVTVRVCPFQYFPERRILRVFRKVAVQVICKGTGGINKLTVSRAERADTPLFQTIYTQRFINYTPETRRYTPLERKGRMLIIAADSLAETVEPLAAWRNQMGIPTDVVNLSGIGSTAEEVKAYVQAAYDTNNLAYLLLVGDGEDMPYPLANSGDDRGASDPSYSKLAGADDYPDILVGRFSGSTTQQIATMVERTISYELDPEAGGGWYAMGTGIASDEEQGGPKDYERMDVIRGVLMSNGYTSVDQIYDPGAQASAVSAAVNAGRGVMNYVGHGDVQEWVTTGFNNANVNALTNTTRWPFIFDVACVNGAFTGATCFAEAWTRAEHNGSPAGAVDIYASTINQDWDPPVSAQNEFNHLLVHGTLTEYGALCFNASMKMMDDYPSSGVAMFNTWTVFGDPAVQVRTDVPTTLSVTHPDVLSSLSYTVTVAGVEGALAGLSMGGAYLGSDYTDGSGTAVITLDKPPVSNVLLTVTAFNAVPYTSAVVVSTAELVCSPDLVEKSLAQDVSAVSSLVVSNAGAVGSVMNYTLTVLPDYSESRSRALPPLQVERSDRNVTGSTVALSASEYTPGVSTTLTVTVHNGSEDEEWIAGAELRFPEQITVSGATKLKEVSWGLDYGGATGTGVAVSWEADNPSDDAVEVAATGTVTVTFSPSATGSLEIGWTLTGDEYGDAPHTVTDLITLAASGPPPPILAMTAPNGGERWAIGSTQSVSWTSLNVSNAVNLDFSSDGGSNWRSIAADLAYSEPYYWIIDEAVQSNNCLMRVVTVDESAASTSAAPFSIYHPLDWLTLSESSGSITGRARDVVSLEFDATGKATGSYHAIVRVDSSVGNVLIPVEMTVLANWNITVTAGANGSVTPSGTVAVANGMSTSFVVEADSEYYVSQLYTNGSSVSGAAGLLVYTSSWNDVRADGTLQADFAGITNATATNGTPVPWLRHYYTNEPDVESLMQQAALDTDQDGLLGWQEYQAVTDPTDPASTFVLLLGPNAVILQWYAATGRVYSVYGATNLTDGFDMLSSNLTTDVAELMNYTNSMPEAASVFYHIGVSE